MEPTTARPCTWQPVCEDTGLWTIEKNANGFWLRSTLLALPDRKLVLVSPIRKLGDTAVEQLEALGEPRFLLAPNHYHHLGLPEYVGRYKSAVVVASDVASPRLRRRTSLAVEDLGRLRAALPSHAAVLEPPGLKNGETWLAVQTKRGLAWVVSDAFFHLPEHPPGLVGLFCRLAGVSAGLRIGSTFLWLALRDRKAYRDWLLKQLADKPPVLLIPGHGDVLHDERLGPRLASLVEERI